MTFCDRGSHLRQTLSDFRIIARQDAERAGKSANFLAIAKNRAVLHEAHCANCAMPAAMPPPDPSVLSAEIDQEAYRGP